MERNRWETAIRCLEIAVHPNTSDEEAIAAIRGFRRTARNVPMSQLYRALPDAAPAHLLGRLDQLNQENRELRRRTTEAEGGRAEVLGHLQQAERRARELGRELLAAEERAGAAERRLAEFRGAYGRLAGGLQHENLDLRRALDDARRNLAQPIHEPVAPFKAVLGAALQRTDQPQPAGLPAPAPSWTA
jgi:septal ring factor EnvC (AmiA/AmiB activator)